MIPAKAKGKLSRDEQTRFHVVERCAVEISDDVEVTVRESNRAMLVNVFSGVVKRQINKWGSRNVWQSLKQYILGNRVWIQK